MCFTCTQCDASFLTDAIIHIMDSSRSSAKDVAVASKPPTKATTPTTNVKQTITTTSLNETPMTFAQLKTDVVKLNSLVQTISRKIDVLGTDVQDVKATTKQTKSTTNEIHKIVNSINENSTEIKTDVTTKVNELVCKTQNVLSSQTDSFANILKQQRIEQRQNVTIKRRLDKTESAKPVSTRPKDIPPAKSGKRTGTNVLAVAPAPTRKPKQTKLPEFNKSLHVSKLDKSVTPELITDFIASNTSLVPNVDFKCSLLVKKGHEIDKLSFISYKVDYFEESGALLEEEEFWDPGVQIRPFVISTTLGDYLKTPSRQEAKKLKSSTDNTNEDTTEDKSNDSTKNEAMLIDNVTASNNESNIQNDNLEAATAPK